MLVKGMNSISSAKNSALLNTLEENYSHTEDYELCIWGMGYVDMLYQNAFANDHTPIQYYISKDVHETHNGYPVISPDQIFTYLKNPLILICAKNTRVVEDIRKDICNLPRKVESMLVDEYFYGKYSLQIRENLSRMDERSSDIYLELICRSASNITNAFDLFQDGHYFAFAPFAIPDENEICVDMGGYVGDTLEEYVFRKHGAFKKYYVFEPDRGNYLALSRRVQRIKAEWNFSDEKIIPINAGVGRDTMKLSFTDRDNAESSYNIHEATCDQSQIWSLDDFFKQGNEEISVLKADIEGFELEMLYGAEKLIRRDIPKLSVSIYHNAYDMIHIPKWIYDLKLGYKLGIRHHSALLDDTVLYAWK